MTSYVDLTSGNVIDVVDGRDSAAVAGWSKKQPEAWRASIQVVAIYPTAPFRKAVIEQLPHAAVAVDHFHMIKLANDIVTAVRRRLSWELKERRGREEYRAWANRLLLLRGYGSLNDRGKAKLAQMLTTDDPTDELGAAWGIKEAFRLIMASPTVEEARVRRRTLVHPAVAAAQMAEVWRLKLTIDTWWPQIETFIATRITNAKTEAANVAIKNLKRAGRGFRSHTYYRSRIMLYNATRTAA